jgi:hypothetical protein
VSGGYLLKIGGLIEEEWSGKTVTTQTDPRCLSVSGSSRSLFSVHVFSSPGAFITPLPTWF